jgi:hypothetical protein
VRTCCFKNFLEVAFGWSGGPLKVASDSCHELYIRVLDFFPGIAIAGRRSKMMQAALLALLSTLSTLFGASDGGTSGRGLTTAGSHTPC